MKPSICLNMIVRNEAPVILRCLKTVKPWIDSWVISDTGSHDGTQNIILNYMDDLPGKLIERPWIDFAQNRNEVLDLARQKADYSLFIDADQQFLPLPSCQGIDVDQELYTIQTIEPLRFKSLSAAYFLLRNTSKMYWKGVLHEYLFSPHSMDDMNGKIFIGASILSITHDGHRSCNPKKYLQDAQVLEDAIKKEPDNARYMFYLGQSYMNAEQFTLALNAFEKRIKMDGTDIGEMFFSLFLIGVLQEQLGMDIEVCLESFLNAHHFRDSRHEPIYKIGQIYIKKRQFEKTYHLLKPYVFVYNLEDQFCVQADIRDFLLPLLYACSCYELKKYEECHYVMKKVLSFPNLPNHLTKTIQNDMNFMKSQLPYLDT